ncbi:UNVERIFIED_ORG: DNA modification methylase [Peribacillus simplex]
MTVGKSAGELKLINGDVFNEIKKIDSNSVHLICTDPPYFISRKTNFKSGGGDQKKYGSISMEFGKWDLEENSLNWFSLLQEFKRVLVPGGTMVIFYDIFKMSDISIVAEKLKLKQKRIGFWEKTNPVPINNLMRMQNLAPEELDIFVGHNFTVTFHESPSSEIGMVRK